MHESDYRASVLGRDNKNKLVCQTGVADHWQTAWSANCQTDCMDRLFV